MPKVRKMSESVWTFFCPGCEYYHPFDQRWTFNGDVEKPTFRPSLMVYGGSGSPRCHSFVTDGKIQFLDDCEHGLKGQTVDLPDWDTMENNSLIIS